MPSHTPAIHTYTCALFLRTGGVGVCVAAHPGWERTSRPAKDRSISPNVGASSGNTKKEPKDIPVQDVVLLLQLENQNSRLSRANCTEACRAAGIEASLGEGRTFGAVGGLGTATYRALARYRENTAADRWGSIELSKDL